MTSSEKTTQRFVSGKAARFTESVIREMTREALKHGAVNLSQGFPDFPAPDDVKQAAVRAIRGGCESICHYVGRQRVPRGDSAKDKMVPGA